MEDPLTDVNRSFQERLTAPSRNKRRTQTSSSPRYDLMEQKRITVGLIQRSDDIAIRENMQSTLKGFILL